MIKRKKKKVYSFEYGCLTNLHFTEQFSVSIILLVRFVDVEFPCLQNRMWNDASLKLRLTYEF